MEHKHSSWDTTSRTGMEIDTVSQLDELQVFTGLDDKSQIAIISYCSSGATFCAAWLAGFGKTGSKWHTQTMAGQFFRNPRIRAAIAEYRALQRAQAEALRETLIESLTEDSFFDTAEAYDANGKALPVPDMPESVRKRIVRYSVSKYGVNIEFVDRLKAKQMLIDLLGIGQVNQGLTVNIDLGETTPAQEKQVGGTLHIDLNP